MKTIQGRLFFFTFIIITVVIAAFLISSTTRTNAILNDDSQDILISAADYNANVIDDNFRSTEQSVGTIYNYALKRAETYSSFLKSEEERDKYTYDVFELGKSTSKTIGADALSALALEQENAAKAEDIKAIENGVKLLLDSYSYAVNNIRKVLG